MKVGVLAVQGAFIEHERVLARLGVEPVEVRLPSQLEGLDGLIIPGGESTTIGKLALKWNLLQPMRGLAAAGCAVWGTCAGMVLMAREVVDGTADQPLLGLMDIVVCRNAFGRQVDSFEASLDVTVLGESPFHAIFIRAPLIERAGKEVEILARLDPALSAPEGEGAVVAAQQGNLVATAFHPELTEDDRFHRYFLSLCRA